MTFTLNLWTMKMIKKMKKTQTNKLTYNIKMNLEILKPKNLF